MTDVPYDRSDNRTAFPLLIARNLIIARILPQHSNPSSQNQYLLKMSSTDVVDGFFSQEEMIQQHNKMMISVQHQLRDMRFSFNVEEEDKALLLRAKSDPI